MKRATVVLLAACAVLLAAAGIAVAQWERQRRGPVVFDRGEVPEWRNAPEFEHDVFTFVRIRYGSPYGGYRGGSWRTDWPASDLNFSFRLQQLTSLKVNPEPVILELTDPALFDYPFIYIVEPGRLAFSAAEQIGRAHV